MTNNFSIYDPLWYAQQGLMQLHMALGMANTVYRGYDKAPQQKGSTITIPAPSTYVAQDAPSAAQDIVHDSIDIKLSRWREVKIKITDKEMNYTGEQMIANEIQPAAYAIAVDIDSFLCQLARQVPWRSGTPGTTPSQVSDLTGVRKLLFNNKVPISPGNIHLMIDGNAEEKFLQLPAFATANGGGDQGVKTMMTGQLGNRYGFDIWANQNVASLNPGTLTAASGVVTANAVGKTGTILNLTGTSLAGTVNTGDIIQIAGDSQNYVVSRPVGQDVDVTYTANGNALAGISIFPSLRQDVASGTAVTITQQAGKANVAFHTNAFALAMAPLSEMGNQLGAKIATVTDPVTNLSLRSRLWYEGDQSRIAVALDVLYGGRVLDGNLAALMLG